MKDPRIDAYITRSAPFARPILLHLRDLVHANCPEIEETIKWGFPNFMYKGMLCGMAAFKAHCAFGFWKSPMLHERLGIPKSDDAMGQFGKITSLADLPGDRVIARFVREAVKIKDERINVPQVKKPPKKPLDTPDDLAAKLERNAKARRTFEALSPSHRREYIEWITDAKREETRTKRLATALEWMAEGKSLNWKYERRTS